MSAANNSPPTFQEQIDIDRLDIEEAVVPSPNGNCAEVGLVTDQLPRLEASQIEPEVRDQTEIQQTSIDALSQPTAEQQRCSICFEDIVLSQLACLQPCGHEFHVLCAETWTRQRNTCSYCKQTIDTMAINFSSCPVNGQTFESRAVEVPAEEVEAPSIVVAEGVFIYSLAPLPFYDIVTEQETVQLVRGDNNETVDIEPQAPYRLLAVTDDMVIRVGVEEYPLAPFIQELRQQQGLAATNLQDFISGLLRIAQGRNGVEAESTGDADDANDADYVEYEIDVTDLEDSDEQEEVTDETSEEYVEEGANNVDQITFEQFIQLINGLSDPESPVQLQFPPLSSIMEGEEPELESTSSVEGEYADLPDFVDTIEDNDSMETNPASPLRRRRVRQRRQPSVSPVEETEEQLPRRRRRTRQSTTNENASDLTRPIRSRRSRVTRNTGQLEPDTAPVHTSPPTTRSSRRSRRARQQQDNQDEEDVRPRPRKRRRRDND